VPIIASRETIGGMPEELARATPVAATPQAWAEQTRALLAGDVSKDLVIDLQARIEEICGAGRVAGALLTAYANAIASTHPLRTERR
jgi:hypothetical protein